MYKVEKKNRILRIPDEKFDEYKKMGYIIRDENDNVLFEPENVKATAEKLKKENDNLAICMDAFGIVSSEVGKMKGQVNAITNKYNMNRAQRRQEGKKNKHGKNGPVITPFGNASGCDNS